MSPWWLILMVIAAAMLILYSRDKSAIANVHNFPPIDRLNDALVANYQHIANEIKALDRKPVSNTVIEEGIIYSDKATQQQLLDKINREDSWTIGWRNNDWMQYPIVFEGKIFPNARKSLPTTCSLIEPIKHCFHTLFISAIRPHGEIPKHRNWEKGMLTYHFNVDCPPTSVITIDGTPVIQKSGNHIVFDSNFEHNVVNNSANSRIVLVAKFFTAKARK